MSPAVIAILIVLAIIILAVDNTEWISFHSLLTCLAKTVSVLFQICQQCFVVIFTAVCTSD